MVTVDQEYERGETHLKTMGIIPVSAFLAISCLPHTGEQEVLKRFVSDLYILYINQNKLSKICQNRTKL